MNSPFRKRIKRVQRTRAPEGELNGSLSPSEMDYAERFAPLDEFDDARAARMPIQGGKRVEA